MERQKRRREDTVKKGLCPPCMELEDQCNSGLSGGQRRGWRDGNSDELGRKKRRVLERVGQKKKKKDPADNAKGVS